MLPRRISRPSPRASAAAFGAEPVAVAVGQGHERVPGVLAGRVEGVHDALVGAVAEHRERGDAAADQHEERDQEGGLHPPNCDSSVEPPTAVVSESPPVMASATSSK